MKRFTYQYTAKNGIIAVAEITTITHDKNKIIVASDLDVGPSVTNNVDTIATNLVNDGFDWDVFLEHYTKHDRERRGNGGFKPVTYHDFSVVTFNWQTQRDPFTKGRAKRIASNPQWKYIEKAAAESYFGGKWESF